MWRRVRRPAVTLIRRRGSSTFWKVLSSWKWMASHRKPSRQVRPSWNPPTWSITSGTRARPSLPKVWVSNMPEKGSRCRSMPPEGAPAKRGCKLCNWDAVARECWGDVRVRLVGQKMRIGKAVRDSIPSVAGGAWKGDRVADVRKAGDIGERSFEAEAKAGVRHRAVAAEIAVPGVLVPVDAALTHRSVQYLKPFLALAAANDL